MRKRPYEECPLCHAHLDYGERCDCQSEKEQRQRMMDDAVKKERETGQYIFSFAVSGRG